MASPMSPVVGASPNTEATPMKHLSLHLAITCRSRSHGTAGATLKTFNIFKHLRIHSLKNDYHRSPATQAPALVLPVGEATSGSGGLQKMNVFAAFSKASHDRSF